MRLTGVNRVFVGSIFFTRSKLNFIQISSLKQWNDETTQLFGPVVKMLNVKKRAGEKKLNSQHITVKDMKQTTVVTTSSSLLDGEVVKSTIKTSIPPNIDSITIQSDSSAALLNDSKYKKDSKLKELKKNKNDVEKSFQHGELEKLALTHILKMPMFPKSYDEWVNLDFWKNVPVMSVSRILKESMSEESKMILQRWEKKMVGVLGETGFEKYKLSLLNNGNNLHSCLKIYLREKHVDEIAPEIEGYWNSLQTVLKDIDNVVSLEQMVTNQSLNYKGILDCVATYQGKPCLIDWKTSQKPKPSIENTYDNPLQLTAYLSAFNSLLLSQNFGDEGSLNQQVLKDLGLLRSGKQLENCLLVVSYEDGSKADVHLMNKKMCTKYWTQWIHRLHRYWSHYFLSQ